MMRQLFAFLMLFSFFACQNEQKKTAVGERQSEMSVQEDFSKRYPNIRDIIWDTLDIGFSGSFSDDNFEHTAYYSIKGLYQFTSTLIEQTDLPVPIQEILDQKYKNAAAAVIMRIENGKNKTYKIELESSTDYINLEFDDSGQLLKEEKHPLSNEEMQREEEEGVDEKEK